MRSRLVAALLPALIVVSVLLPTAVAAATTAPQAIVLAVEGGEGEAPPGPEPMPPDASGNPAAPQPYEPQFIWATSVLLLVPIVLLTLFGGVVYYLRVHRPRRQQST